MGQDINREAEGIWPCTILHGKFGEDDKGSPEVQISARMDEGPRKGQVFTYQDQVNNKSALYIQRSCRAVGWKGPDLNDLKRDIDAWIKSTGGKTTGEIKVIEVKRGKKYDEWVDSGMEGPPPCWEKLNSFGRGAKPLVAATPERLRDANDAMRAAMEADGYTPPAESQQDAPHAADSDDLPF